MAESPDIRLVVEISNKQPLELLDLTKALVSLSTQFNSYASQFGEGKEERTAKLYVKEIRSGSVILELIETATVGMIPFIEHSNTIFGFAKYIKNCYNYFLGKSKAKPESLTTNDYKDLSQIINPVAADNGSQLNLSTTINGNVELHIHVTSLEANAIQNKIDKEAKEAKTPTANDDVRTKVLLTWFQARGDIKATTGNKAIIDGLSAKPLNVVFENDELKEKMLHSDDNPFNTVYVVDVIILTVQEQSMAYKIVALHDKFQIDNERKEAG